MKMILSLLPLFLFAFANPCFGCGPDGTWRLSIMQDLPDGAHRYQSVPFNKIVELPGTNVHCAFAPPTVNEAEIDAIRELNHSESAALTCTTLDGTQIKSFATFEELADGTTRMRQSIRSILSGVEISKNNQIFRLNLFCLTKGSDLGKTEEFVDTSKGR